MPRVIRRPQCNDANTHVEDKKRQNPGFPKRRLVLRRHQLCNRLVLALPFTIIAAIGEVNCLVRFGLGHLSPCTPAQHAECDHYHDASDESCSAERLTSAQPVGNGDDEDCQQTGDTGQHRARKTDQYQEAAGKSRIHNDTAEKHPSRVSRRQVEFLDTGPVQNGKRNPQHRKREETDARTERVGEDHTAVRATAFRRASISLVKHLVETVEDGSDTDDQVAGDTVPGRLLMSGIVLAGTSVTVRNDQDTGNGHDDGKRFVQAQRLLEQRNREDVGEESRTVVDGRQIGGSRQVHSDIPTQATNSQSRCNEGCGLDDIAPRGDTGLRVGPRIVKVLSLDHDGGRMKQLSVSSPEGCPRDFALVESQEQQLDRPQHHPGAMGQVEHAVSLIPV